MGLQDYIEFALGLIIGTVSVLLLVFWVTVIIYRLRKTLKKYKHYLKEFAGDSHLRSEIIQALETGKTRDILLLIVIVLEIVTYFCCTLVIPQLNIHVYQNPEYIQVFYEQFPNCSNFNPLIAFSYIYPANTFMFVTLSMLIIAQFMIISFLNSYLAVRYFGYSIPKKVVYKYIFCWVFQYSILSIFIIPELVIFLPIVLTVLLIFNWLNLIITSKSMCSSIRSKIVEIKLFEWNPDLYKNLSNTLRSYKLFMGILILGFLFFVLTLGFLSIAYLLNIIIFSNAFLGKVYGIHLTFNIPKGHALEHFDAIQRYVAIALAVVYSLCLLIPSLFMFLNYTLSLIYNRCTGKVNMSRFNAELFKPLMDDKY